MDQTRDNSSRKEGQTVQLAQSFFALLFFQVSRS